MRGRLFAKAGVIAALALALGACFGGGNVPSELLTLTPNDPPAAGATRSGGPGEGLAVLTPSVPQALSTTRIPVYVSPTVIQYLQNATWVEPPKDLFRRLLAQTISGRTGRLVLNPDLYTEVQGPTLTGQLLQFGYDPSQAAVVVTFEAALSRGAQSVQTQRFESRVPVAQAVTTAVAPALNQAANDVAEQVADWIGR
jgi:cholesterol transport system auxiliary component